MYDPKNMVFTFIMLPTWSQSEQDDVYCYTHSNLFPDSYDM